MNKQPISLVFRLLERCQKQDSVPQARAQSLLAQCMAEALGTFGLVFAGCGAIMINALYQGQVTHVGIGLVFGLIITVMIYAFGHISGAHFNPAVTLAFVLVRHFPIRRLLFYWAAQFVGATLAALCLLLLLGDVASLGTALPSASSNEWQSLGMEILLTFFLMIVIMAMATDTRAVGQAAALAIGGTIMLEALFAGPISGASMNPARSLGPALVSGTWTVQWVYLLGPFLGASAGALVYDYLRKASIQPRATQHKEKERIPISWSMTAPPRDSFFHEPATKAAGDTRKTVWNPVTPPTDSLNPALTRPLPESKPVLPDAQKHFTTKITLTNVRPMRVLFLSTLNSARSQMAEGLLRSHAGQTYEVFSAGTNPTSVHPLAIKAMWEIGVDISTYRSKWIEEFTAGPPIDLVVTLCDDAANAYPAFPNTRWQLHWSFPDPNQSTGSAEERLTAFRHIRELLAAQIKRFPADPSALTLEELRTTAQTEQYTPR